MNEKINSDFNRINKYKTLQKVVKETGISYVKVEKVVDFFEEFIFTYLNKDGEKPVKIPFIGKFYKVTRKEQKKSIKQSIQYVQNRRKLLENKPSFEDVLRRHLQGGQE